MIFRRTCPAALSRLMAAGPAAYAADAPCITAASTTSAEQSGITHLLLACVTVPALPGKALSRGLR
jgi:hypothetical protein